MNRIVHWTIKVTWKDEMNNRHEEYLEDIPYGVAKWVDNYQDQYEIEANEEEE